jgi:hypothetical protein
MKVLGIDLAMRDLIFSCDALASTVAAEFLKPTPGPGLSVYVNRDIDGNGTVSLSIGYWDPKTRSKNWYKPYIVSSPTGITVLIKNFQEGGFLNSHFNKTYSITANSKYMDIIYFFVP